MVEKRGLAAEAFLSHQLLCVQRTVGPPELGVAFAWDFAGASVIRHSASTPRVTHMHYRAVTRADVFCARTRVNGVRSPSRASRVVRFSTGAVRLEGAAPR